MKRREVVRDMADDLHKTVVAFIGWYMKPFTRHILRWHVSGLDSLKREFFLLNFAFLSVYPLYSGLLLNQYLWLPFDIFECLEINIAARAEWNRWCLLPPQRHCNFLTKINFEPHPSSSFTLQNFSSLKLIWGKVTMSEWRETRDKTTNNNEKYFHFHCFCFMALPQYNFFFLNTLFPFFFFLDCWFHSVDLENEIPLVVRCLL